MNLNYFAGAIFTPEEVFLFGAIAFLIVGTAVGLLIFAGKKLSEKTKSPNSEVPINPKSRISLPVALLIGFGVVAAAILAFGVIPTMISDGSYRNKQERCAREAGYESVADDNDPDKATGESQAAFRACLYPNGL